MSNLGSPAIQRGPPVKQQGQDIACQGDGLQTDKLVWAALRSESDGVTACRRTLWAPAALPCCPLCSSWRPDLCLPIPAAAQLTVCSWQGVAHVPNFQTCTEVAAFVPRRCQWVALVQLEIVKQLNTSLPQKLIACTTLQSPLFCLPAAQGMVHVKELTLPQAVHSRTHFAQNLSFKTLNLPAGG